MVTSGGVCGDRCGGFEYILSASWRDHYFCNYQYYHKLMSLVSLEWNGHVR